MKKLILSTILATASLSSAATINWANGGGRGHAFVLNDGTTRVPNGSLVRLGYFETAGNTSSPFIEFGTTTLGDPGGGVLGGHIPAAGKAITNNTVSGNSFGSTQLYLWVYNAPTAAAATQSGIFTAATWTPGADFNNNAATFNVTLGQTVAPVVAASYVTTPGVVVPGSYAQGGVQIGATTNTNASVYALGLMVPEPTSASLVLIALGAIARRKRA